MFERRNTAMAMIASKILVIHFLRDLVAKEQNGIRLLITARWLILVVIVNVVLFI